MIKKIYLKNLVIMKNPVKNYLQLLQLMILKTIMEVNIEIKWKLELMSLNISIFYF